MSFGRKAVVLTITLFVQMCACLSVCAWHVCRCPERSEGGVDPPELELTGGCESHYVGAGIRTWVLCKSSKC